ncbi:MAG: hypothetical protein AABW50_05280 [Nanoarchaeota archaeon]
MDKKDRYAEKRNEKFSNLPLGSVIKTGRDSYAVVGEFRNGYVTLYGASRSSTTHGSIEAIVKEFSKNGELDVSVANFKKI